MRTTLEVLPAVIDQCQALELVGVQLSELPSFILSTYTELLEPTSWRAALTVLAALALLGLRQLPEPHVRRCRVCGCTDLDCSQCIQKTGAPCSWVELDLCSACAPPDVPRELR
jgi:hypothetical protein